MNSIKKTAEKIDTKVLLSTLWIVVMINMLKADILSLFIPGALDEVAKTAASSGTSDSPTDAGCRDHRAARHCHDRPVPRVEVRNQSLGQYRRWHPHHCLYLGWHGIVSPLPVHCQRRDPLSVADHLVCMDLAQRRSLIHSK